MTDRVVLDASALLAMFNQEPGSAEVANALDRSMISAVNLTEVLTKLSDQGIDVAEAWEEIRLMEIDVVPFESEMARRAAALRATTRKAGLSLGDRACLALGMARKASILTADRAWRGLKLDADIRVVR